MRPDDSLEQAARKRGYAWCAAATRREPGP